mmetsp:Transcript_29528/g.55243  ORF Transcript_29528/g.55243 Transcript_29528/m.55243 type:complete len:99 (-) Transcript_29528:23-319(-)
MSARRMNKLMLRLMQTTTTNHPHTGIVRNEMYMYVACDNEKRMQTPAAASMLRWSHAITHALYVSSHVHAHDVCVRVRPYASFCNQLQPCEPWPVTGL